MLNAHALEGVDTRLALLRSKEVVSKLVSKSDSKSGSPKVGKSVVTQPVSQADSQ